MTFDVDPEKVRSLLGLKVLALPTTAIKRFAPYRCEELCSKWVAEELRVSAESCRDARDVIGRLQVAGGVETIDALRTAIRQSDEMRDRRRN